MLDSNRSDQKFGDNGAKHDAFFEQIEDACANAIGRRRNRFKAGLLEAGTSRGQPRSPLRAKAGAAGAGTEPPANPGGTPG